MDETPELLHAALSRVTDLGNRVATYEGYPSRPDRWVFQPSLTWNRK